jgi:hypothetical protein
MDFLKRLWNLKYSRLLFAPIIAIRSEVVGITFFLGNQIDRHLMSS